jgi:putative transposase
MMAAVTELVPTLGVAAACRALGVPRSSYYRTQPQLAAPSASPDEERPAASGPAAADGAGRHRRPSRALTPDERANVRELLNSDRFADRSPREVYATLLDEGQYYCSWSTMYRILRSSGELRRRRDQARRSNYTKPELLATRPNQLWSWDITKLKGPTSWTYFYLYVILDVYSRYVVGWMLAECESAELAEALIAQTCAKEQIAADQLTLHADRGSAMTSKTVAQLLSDLGVTKSHSRPSVSDDNPFSEAQFKTVKYHPTYPDRFGSSADARAWAKAFFEWYNHEHYHSALGLLTPSSVHHGQVATRLAARQAVLTTAYQAHPERFVRGQPCPASPPAAVWINPPRDRTTPLPGLFSATPERAGPVQPAGAEASRGFTAQRPLDASAPAGYAVAERPVVAENQSAAP